MFATANAIINDEKLLHTRTHAQTYEAGEGGAGGEAQAEAKGQSEKNI